MDTALLHSLADRVAMLAAPSAMHPAVWRVDARVTAWAQRRGLLLGDPDGSPLGRAQFARLAARLLPGADEDRVTLLAQWLTWAFALDDTFDESPLGGSATAVHGLYADLLAALRRGHAKPEARPLELALAELWQATTPGMSRAWRHRVLVHLEEHRAGCADEAVNRRIGRAPCADDYPALRRRAAGPYLYDLVEPILGVELPAALAGGPAWKELTAGTADMILWTNDLVSYPKEAERGDAHNHVAVIRDEHGFAPEQAARWVLDYIAHRAADVQAAARVVQLDLDRLKPPPEQRAAALGVTQVLLGAPRAHLDWLAESGRYTGCPVTSPDDGRSPPPTLEGWHSSESLSLR